MTALISHSLTILTDFKNKITVSFYIEKDPHKTTLADYLIYSNL